jgi:outer membrane protein assembly factor BamB
VTGHDAQRQKLETFCLDALDGKILWRREAPSEKIENWFHTNSPATPTPATDGRRVYVYFGSCGLLCYDLDGKEVWKRALAPPANQFGSGTSPVVAGEVLLLVCQGKQASLVAFSARTGTTLWKKEKPIHGVGYAVPLLRPHENGTEVVLLGPRGVQAFDLKTGAERWSVGGLLGGGIPSPAAGDGLLFVVAHFPGGDPDDRMKLPSFDELIRKYDANKDGLLASNEVPMKMILYDRGAKEPDDNITMEDMFPLIDKNRDGKLDSKEWAEAAKALVTRDSSMLAIRPGGKGEISKESIIWREKRALPEVPSPLYYRGRLYVVKDGGLVSCFEARTGKLLYRKRLGAAGVYYASPVAGDGKVYVASNDGVVTVFDAGDQLRVLARNALGETILATPAFADGKIYIRTEIALYAFRES